ncbi:MAG: HTTM domain-containing protein [Bacteroidia bacterium]|nr:HTTM domain-containing protein [Bacteroidia bacterium]
MIKKLSTYLNTSTRIAPLVVFRIAFGALMFLSIIRFILKGWVYNMYVMPKIYFPYFGFEWVKPLPETGMYIVFVLLLLSSLGILFGLLYRFSALTFFLLFTYIELIDKTNYLNHYYFVSIVSFMLIFVPAAQSFSLDNKILKRQNTTHIPQFYILIFQFQMALVYFFAGLAKVNYDWLFEAQPLKIWLPAFSHYPIIGNLMEKDWIAYFFSWFSCIYDLCIGFLLFQKRFVKYAYMLVIIFHVATALFFNIGMFPYIMMTITLIFFGPSFHETILRLLGKKEKTADEQQERQFDFTVAKTLVFVFLCFFIIQITLPFRYVFYPGKLFWTEQGYRFSWRVMLMEKAGTAFFYVTDKKSGRQSEVDNKEYLTYMQEKMMATQPDMMVDYAKFLKKEYIKKGYHDPIVTSQCYVTLNGSGSRLFIDPNVDLAMQSNSFLQTKSWVHSY